MTTLTPERPAPAPLRRRPNVWLLAPLAIAANAGLIAILYNFHRGANAARIANPAVQGVPRPVRFLFGHTDWVVMEELGLMLALMAGVGLFVFYWQRYPKHPILLMTLAATALIWLDPVMNWAPYAVYNPQLTHWSPTWPLASLSPTVEPLIVLGYATFYVGPFFPAVWVLRRIQQRRPVTSLVWRHPLLTLTVLIFVIGFLFDAILEIVCVRTGLYIYSQVIPWGSLWAGKWYQFPLLWESSLVTLVMIPAGVLLYRDDTGRTQAEKLTHRVRAFRGRPALGTFAVMFAVLNVAYLCYGAGFAIIRDTKAATSVACPWPFPEAKVYDPQGFYAKAGGPAPYSAGNWDGWESGQSGRPDVTTATSGGCTP